jgi:hypothetical protein
MAIPSQEIGYGTEEKLLWQISKQIQNLIGVTYNSGSGFSTTYVPYTGATSNVNLDGHNISANAFINGFSSITASGTQVVLTVDSAPEILVSGSGGQTIKLPDATTLANGTTFTFNNNQSSGAISVNNNSNTLVASIPSGGYISITLLSNSIAAGSWDRHDLSPANVSWSTNTFDYPGSITSATWNGTVIAPNRGGTGQSTYTDGQLLIGNTTGNTLSKSTLTAGTGIAITNGNGSITITATGAVSGAVTGSGTTNYIPKFTSSTVVGNSNIQDSGSLITLGSNTTISSGGLAIGAAVTIGGVSGNLNLNKNITGGTLSYAVTQTGIVQSDVTTLGISYLSALNTQATAFTLAEYRHFSAAGATLGAGSTLTVQTGYHVGSNHIQGTNNYGFRSLMSAGTNRWNLYMDGTAQNYLAGSLLIGSTTNAGFKLDVTGTTRFIGTTASDTAPLGSELAGVTGTGTNWALASGATNLNVGGYVHTVGDVTPLTTSLAAVNGTYYQIAYTITGRTAGSITIAYGGTSTAGITATGNTGPKTSSTAVLTITPTTDFNGTVVLSIKTIGVSSASSTFANSSGTSYIEVRANSDASNTFIGLNAGTRNTTASQNTFIGQAAGQNNTTGAINTFVGQGAGFSNTTGVFNSFFGTSCGVNNTIGGFNSFFGASTGTSNTTGSNNTFIGQAAGAYNTTGGSNTFIGASAGQTNTIGGNNTFVGNVSGYSNTTGTTNVGLGAETLYANTTGNTNVAIGGSTLGSNISGSQNTGVGGSTLQLITNGSGNTSLGFFNLNGLTSGSNNTTLGGFSGRFIADGATVLTSLSNSILIGYQTYPLANSQTNQIVIGYQSTGLGSNTTVLGNSSTTLTALYGAVITGGTSIDASAQLQADSTTKGFLPPRMTTTQKNAIATPATGLVVFDTTLGKLCVFSTTWQTITSL